MEEQWPEQGMAELEGGQGSGTVVAVAASLGVMLVVYLLYTSFRYFGFLLQEVEKCL